MKVTLKESEQPIKLRYPILMKSTYRVVMFISETSGFRVYDSDNPDFVFDGTIEQWVRATDQKTWTPFNGCVVLSN